MMVNNNEELPVNLRSFAELEDRYDVTDVQRKDFIIHIGNGKNIYFKRKGKQYLCDWENKNDNSKAFVCVNELEKQYTKREIDMAREARDQMRTLGYISKDSMIQ